MKKVLYLFVIVILVSGCSEKEKIKKEKDYYDNTLSEVSSNSNKREEEINNIEELEEDVFQCTNNNPETLKDALCKEQIKMNLGEYKEEDRKVNIYLFRGEGCGHCEAFLTFLGENASLELGNYFNLVSYEVWSNEENEKIMNNVSHLLNEKVGGVPYIVIGKKTFLGFNEKMEEDIIHAIKEEYDKNAKDRWDALEMINRN